ASVPAGALPDLFTDTWFVREGSGEREVSTATCGAMTCQAVDLPALNWGNCIELADAHDEFVSGDEISKYFSRVVPPESGEGSGSTSSGISASYTCQSDGSWLQTGTPAGGGGSCTDCAFEFVDRWRKDGADVYDWTCTKSCAGSRSSNYSYNGVTGLSHYIPETQSIS